MYTQCTVYELHTLHTTCTLYTVHTLWTMYTLYTTYTMYTLNAYYTTRTLYTMYTVYTSGGRATTAFWLLGPAVVMSRCMAFMEWDSDERKSTRLLEHPVRQSTVICRATEPKPQVQWTDSAHSVLRGSRRAPSSLHLGEDLARSPHWGCREEPLSSQRKRTRESLTYVRSSGA